jgi:hypothetical protein
MAHGFPVSSEPAMIEDLLEFFCKFRFQIWRRNVAAFGVGALINDHESESFKSRQFTAQVILLGCALVSAVPDQLQGCGAHAGRSRLALNAGLRARNRETRKAACSDNK